MRSGTRATRRTIVRATGLLGLLAFLPLTLKLGAKDNAAPISVEVKEACASGACCVQLGSTCIMGGATNHIYKVGGCSPP
jgi:hypothetical protein